MRRPSQRNAAVALLSAVALALFTVFSFQASAVALEPHADHSHHAEQRIEGPEPAADHGAPGEHCHPGFDCFVIVALEPPAVGFPSGPAPALPDTRIEERFQSSTMSPQPPPPRAGILPQGGPMQT